MFHRFHGARIAAVVQRGGAICLASAFLIGCGGSKPQLADPDKAKSTLQTTLDAWKQGATYDSLQKAAPPIHVSDSLWQGGRQLVDYTIEEERQAGFGWRCQVLLTLKTTEGATQQRRATYRIDTEPALVVVHEE